MTNEFDLKYLEEILELNEIDRIIGQIYVIKCTKSNKKYVGQTRTHRKNKKKYRPFGYIGRYNDHIHEAFSTKKNSCWYLNNAIKKYGKECFSVELIEYCGIEKLDEREEQYIEQYGTLYPNGYNLTKGGKNRYNHNIKNKKIIVNDKNITKRGRDFGYEHTEETKIKMSLRIINFCKSEKIINQRKTEYATTMSKSIKKHYDEFKIKKLSELELDNDYEKYIKPLYKDKKLYDYHIYYNRDNRFRVKSENDTIEEKYNRLKEILKQAHEIINNKNSNNI